MICGIIEMNIKVTSDDEFMRRGSNKKGKKIVFDEMENGLEGWMMKEGSSC